MGKVVFLNALGHAGQLGVPVLILGERGPDAGQRGLTSICNVSQTVNCLACGLSMCKAAVPLVIKSLETLAQARSRRRGVRNIPKLREGRGGMTTRLPEENTESEGQEKKPSHQTNRLLERRGDFSPKYPTREKSPGTSFSDTPRLQTVLKMDENAFPYPKALGPLQISVGTSAEASDLPFRPLQVMHPVPPMRAPDIPVSFRPVVDSKKPERRLAGPLFGVGDDRVRALMEPRKIMSLLSITPSDRYSWKMKTRDSMKEVFSRALVDVHPMTPLVLLPATRSPICNVPSIHGFTIPIETVMYPSRQCLRMLRTSVLSGAMALLVDNNTGAWGMGVLTGAALRDGNVIIQAVAVLAVSPVVFPVPSTYRFDGLLFEQDALVPDMAYIWNAFPHHPATLLFRQFVDLMPVGKGQLDHQLRTEQSFEFFL